jgi:hypothetical protein
MIDARRRFGRPPSGYDRCVTREEHGRLVIRCDNCPVRIDLGPAVPALARNRTPSGWVAAGFNRHYCPSCSAAIGLAGLAASHARRQPLVA